MRIKILAVGGTIDKVYFDAKSAYEVGPPNVAVVLHDLNLGFEYDIESLLQKDSLEMTDEDRAFVADSVHEADEDRILITHGTDTMVETAIGLGRIEDKTIVIFTSDHGYHLGEHDFWAKVSLRDESSQVPLIISVPGKKPAVCRSLVELIDLYPTLAGMCGLEAQDRLQGLDIAPMLSTNSWRNSRQPGSWNLVPGRSTSATRSRSLSKVSQSKDT